MRRGGRGAVMPWSKQRYEQVLSAKWVTVVSREYWAGCMQKRNVHGGQVRSNNSRVRRRSEAGPSTLCAML